MRLFVGADGRDINVQKYFSEWGSGPGPVASEFGVNNPNEGYLQYLLAVRPAAMGYYNSGIKGRQVMEWTCSGVSGG